MGTTENPARTKADKNFIKKYLFLLLVIYLSLIIVIFLFNLFMSLKYQIDWFKIFENIFGMLSFSDCVMPKWIFISNILLGMIHNAIFLGIIVAGIIEYVDIMKIPKKL